MTETSLPIDHHYWRRSISFGPVYPKGTSGGGSGNVAQFDSQGRRFLVIYHGSEMPHDPEIMAQAKAAFEGWVAEVGDAVVDPGAPLRMVAQVSRSGADEPVDVSGYSIIEAKDAERLGSLAEKDRSAVTSYFSHLLAAVLG